MNGVDELSQTIELLYPGVDPCTQMDFGELCESFTTWLPLIEQLLWWSTVITLVLGIFWTWMFYHALRHQVEKKGYWITFMVIFGLPISLLYFFIVRNSYPPKNSSVKPTTATKSLGDSQ